MSYNVKSPLRKMKSQNIRTVKFISSLTEGLNNKALQVKLQADLSRNSLYSRVLYSWRHGFLKPFLLWLLWMIMGTCFYGNSDFDGDFIKGFYFSVNVGYSIGWGILFESNQLSYFFSTIYILIGATAISGSLAYLIDSSLESVKLDSRNHVFEEENIQDSKPNWLLKIEAILRQRAYQLLLVWMMFILFGTVWSCYAIGWTPIEGLYFAVSSLSTGGLHGIPPDSEDWKFFIVGVYACTGVPVMAMTMGNFAAAIVNERQKEKLEKEINAKSSWLEQKVMDTLAIEGSTRTLTKHEFLVLTLARTGVVDVGLLTKIYQRFDELDTDEDGLLDYSDVFNKPSPEAEVLSISVNPIQTDNMSEKSTPPRSRHNSRSDSHMNLSLKKPSSSSTLETAGNEGSNSPMGSVCSDSEVPDVEMTPNSRNKRHSLRHYKAVPKI